MRRFMLALLVVAPLWQAPARAAELVMFETAGCPWCIAWHAGIGPIYPKTPEGRIAPLRRVELRGRRPADLAGIADVRFTPTFVLMHEGVEIGRIVGYSGEDFFWGLLATLIERLPREPGS